jgi:diphosphomevalonate decarboxylase
VCLDTFPPIFYLNQESKNAINLIHEFNSQDNEVNAAYTFDAGCNPFIIYRKSKENQLKERFTNFFGNQIIKIMDSEINMRF